MAPRLLAALLAFAALPALAGTWKWVDEKGQVNYSNAPPPHAAGKSQAVEEKLSVMGMDPAVRAWAERRFAEQARAEEADWQLRQQAAAAQARSLQAASTPASYSDYPYDAAPYYYGGGYYRTAYLRRPGFARAITNVPRAAPYAPHSRPASISRLATRR